MFMKDINFNFACAVVVALLVLAFFTILTRPTIGKMNAYFFVQSALTFNIEGGTFYFFTNGPSQYPEGPHFGIWFYTTGLGLIVGICNLIGMTIYNRYMKHWKYHSLFL